jgi:hypothetical protein
MLAHAFSEDDALQNMTGEKEFNEAKMISLFRFIVKASLKYGYVFATSPEIEGIIIWLPENVTYLSVFDFFTCGGTAIIFKHGFSMPWNMMKYEAFIAKRHNYHINEPHWYLLAIAVGKAHRKKGHSSRLMRPFLDYFDKSGMPAYLETGKGNNEAMYRHYGFDLIEKIELPGGGVFKAMLRHPKT